MSRWRTVWLMLMFAVMWVNPASAQPDPADTLLAEVGRGQIHSVVWHPGGDHFYVNTVKGATGAWRYDATTLDGQPMGLASVWLAPGGRWLMATDEAGVWQVLALDDERLIRGDLHNLTFSPDGRWATAAMGADQPIELLDGETLETVGVLPDESGDGMRWKPDSTGWFTPAEAGTVQLWWVDADGDIQAGERLGEPGEEMRWVLHPSDDRLMQYNPQGAATVYDTQTGEVVDRFQAEIREPYYETDGVWYMDWSPDGRAYRVSDNSGGSSYIVSYLDVETHEILLTFSNGELPHFPQHTPDGRYILNVTGIYNANTYERIHDLTLLFLHLSPDGKKVFTGGYMSEIFQVYDIQTGTLLFGHERYPNRSNSDLPYGQYRAWWSPDSTRLLAQDATNGLWLYDATTGQQLRHQGGHVGYHYDRAVEYSPDSSIVAISNQLNVVHLYDIQTGALLTELNYRTRSHVHAIEQMIWHPDGDYLAIRTQHPTAANGGLEQRKVFIWTPEGRLVYVIEHPARADSMIWAADGSRLIASFGPYLSAWYPPPRQPVVETWDDGFGNYANISFSPNKRFLVVTSSTGTHGSSGLIVRDAQTLERLSNQMDITYRRWSWTGDSQQIRVLGTQCEAYMPPSDCRIVLYVGFDADAPVDLTPVPYHERTSPEPVYTFGDYEDEPILLWSPDGSKVAVLADEYVDVWAVGSEQAELIDTFQPGERDRFEWGEDSTPQMIRTRDTGTFRPVFSPDGRTYITTEGGVLRMYRVGASD